MKDWVNLKSILWLEKLDYQSKIYIIDLLDKFHAILVAILNILITIRIRWKNGIVVIRLLFLKSASEHSYWL